MSWQDLEADVAELFSEQQADLSPLGLALARQDAQRYLWNRSHRSQRGGGKYPAAIVIGVRGLFATLAKIGRYASRPSTIDHSGRVRAARRVSFAHVTAAAGPLFAARVYCRACQAQPGQHWCHQHASPHAAVSAVEHPVACTCFECVMVRCA